MSAIDHKEKAEVLLTPVGSGFTDFDQVQSVARAQVHATLYLAEQQRLTALATIWACVDASNEVSEKAWSLIASELGLS